MDVDEIKKHHEIMCKAVTSAVQEFEKTTGFNVKQMTPIREDNQPVNWVRCAVAVEVL